MEQAIRLRPLERSRRTLEDIPADAYLFHRIGGERDANGVANALGQQHADADGQTDRAGTKPANLGNAEMQRLLDELRKLAVGLDRHEHVREALPADLEVAQVEFGENFDMAQRRFHQGVRCGFAVFFTKSFSNLNRRSHRRAAGSPRSRAACTTARTRSSLMLPGLSPRQSTPSSATPNTIL